MKFENHLNFNYRRDISHFLDRGRGAIWSDLVRFAEIWLHWRGVAWVFGRQVVQHRATNSQPRTRGASDFPVFTCVYLCFQQNCNLAQVVRFAATRVKDGADCVVPDELWRRQVVMSSRSLSLRRLGVLASIIRRQVVKVVRPHAVRSLGVRASGP